MAKWLSGIAATVIAALIVWWITERGVEPPPPPPRPPSSTPSSPATPKPSVYDPYQSFISAATSSEARNPLKDPRVRDAIRLVLRGEDLKQAKRLMSEAGWPNGLSLNLLMSRFNKEGGSEGEADLLISKLQRIGVRVRKIH